MGMAYVNVVRMHLLIFVFALSEAFKMHSFTIYAIVYAVYFFPWSEVKQLKRSNKSLLTYFKILKPARCPQTKGPGNPRRPHRPRPPDPNRRQPQAGVKPPP